jgi:NADPH:quinone reductase-like Zn-dependent oxidoreductase
VKAAVVKEFGASPVYDDFCDPTPEPDEVRVKVLASAVSPLARKLADGTHYSANRALPMVAGFDGVGLLASGERVYFIFPRAPFGSMAEFTVPKTRWVVPVPEGLDDISAAAIPNSGLSSWIALKNRSAFKPGAAVFINGATGSAGGLAVQIAKHLGASKVIAAGRNAARLKELAVLGADITIQLDQTEGDLAKEYDQIFSEGVDVVLDYLWGRPAEQILTAIGRRSGSREGEPRIEFVQIGASAGQRIALAGDTLRSTGLQLIGSGLGAFSLDASIMCVGELLKAIGPASLAVPTRSVSLSKVADVWSDMSEAEKIVLRP